MAPQPSATTSIQAASLFNVNGLVVVITGGGSGIGLMMARALALNGASKVYIIGRRKEVLESAAKSIPDHNIIIPIVGDVTSQESVASCVSKIQTETGYINLLVANSGISGPKPIIPSPQIKSIEEFQASFIGKDSEGGGQEGFDRYVDTFGTNVGAVWYTIVNFLGLLDEGNKKCNVEQRSQVITTGSIGGFLRFVAGGYAYGQSKAAVTHMTKQIATNLAPFGIRANVLAPGLFPSDLAAHLIGDGHFSRDSIPLERAGSEEDMAGAILFMASKAGAYCSGNVLLIDGGRTGLRPSVY